jgi:hypothetical protein
VKNTTILHYFWDKIITGSEKMAMKAHIRIASFHWVIVEQIKDPETTYLLGADESFSLTGLSNEQYEFRVKRISARAVDLEYLGPNLALIPENKSIGEGQPCTKLILKLGESRKIATPTCDAGIVWDIRIEEII